MASYAVKLGHQKDIISQMTKEQQSNLSKGLIMVFRVHHIVQQHPDHPDHRITIKMSEKLLDVKIEVFLSHQDSYKFMSDVISNILQLHKDSRGRFLPHRGDGVQLVLSGCLDNKPTPVASEKMFITLFNLYFRHQVRSGYKIDGPFIILIVIDCEIMRCHQFIDLNEAIAWWESMPVSAHDMVPVTNSSSSIYAEYKIRRLLGLSQVMK